MLLPSHLQRFIEPTLFGRYISLGEIAPLITRFPVEVIGESVNGNPIPMLKIGTGPKRILAWSQMHGNESTTTKAVFDLMNFLASDDPDAAAIRSSITLYLVPMLNPDGAEKYTRENANGIDLNRDFLNLTQPESNALMRTFEEVRPDFCFNLHDQRTIYGAGHSGKPATVSFLSPSFDENRSLNTSRTIAMEIIAEMNDSLQQIIPGMVARFDDSFNRNCVGDTFQQGGSATILFEAGHFPGDYQRELTRQCLFIALCTALRFIGGKEISGQRTDDYLNIPQNKIVFYDFVYRNVKINYDNKDIITNFAAHYDEELIHGNEIRFNAIISEIGIANGIFGHRETDAAGARYLNGAAQFPVSGEKANFTLEGIGEFQNGLLQSNL
ncbi:MAG: DUF2817 domain-containing protein [Flavobacterium sp.]|nr:MAG: DUF2817 domain-containing protein [Flavobacterium sp.]